MWVKSNLSLTGQAVAKIWKVCRGANLRAFGWVQGRIIIFNHVLVWKTISHWSRIPANSEASVRRWNCYKTFWALLTLGKLVRRHVVHLPWFKEILYLVPNAEIKLKFDDQTVETFSFNVCIVICVFIRWVREIRYTVYCILSMHEGMMRVIMDDKGMSLKFMLRQNSPLLQGSTGFYNLAFSRRAILVCTKTFNMAPCKHWEMVDMAPCKHWEMVNNCWTSTSIWHVYWIWLFFMNLLYSNRKSHTHCLPAKITTSSKQFWRKVVSSQSIWIEVFAPRCAPEL